MDDVIAVITFEIKNRKITDLKTTKTKFRFKCKRCAALCCKLGGPVITRRDAERIDAAGYRVKDFLEPTGGLKTRADGSCIFLEFDNEKNYFQCGIYDHRPALCRLYPFSFEELGSNRVALKIIPCCRGLNTAEGKVLDKKFVSDRLLEPLLEAMNLQEEML